MARATARDLVGPDVYSPLLFWLRILHAALPQLLVAQPSRWSPIVIWVFVGRSSSWPWEPHIRRFKLLKPVLRTQLAVFDPFFCKMYLLYRSCPRRKSFSSNFCLFPSQNDCFLQPLVNFRGLKSGNRFKFFSGLTKHVENVFFFAKNGISFGQVLPREHHL